MLTTVTSFYANPYSRTTYANNVKNSKLDAGTAAIRNIEYASYSRGNYTPEKAERKRRKKKAPGGRSFLNRRNSSFAYSSRIQTEAPPSGQREIAA